MATRKGRRSCRICGAATDGKGELCARCARLQPARGDTARRVAEKVRDRLAGEDRGGFICPFCRRELSWDTLGTIENETTIYVREKIYFCPHCRAFLGVSSWHTEG